MIICKRFLWYPLTLLLLSVSSLYAQSNGSITSSQCVPIDVQGDKSTVGVQVTGTWTGTLQPQVSIQSQASQNAQVTPSTSTVPQSTITANGLYYANVGGAGTFQVCGNTVTSGTAVVWLNASKGLNVALLAGGSTQTLAVDRFPGSDFCAQVNAAYLALPSSGGTLDARNFSGSIPCNSNMFHGANKAVMVQWPCATVVTSVPQSTPQLSNIEQGCATGNGQNTNGTIIQLCGPSAASWTGSSCSVNGVTVPQFPNGTNQIVFHNVNHGPYPPGTYAAALYGGAQSGSGDFNGWNTDGFGHEVYDIRVDLGGLTSVFGYYSANDEERSIVDRFSCGNGGGATVDARVGCVVEDRLEASTGQSGPTHFRLGDIHANFNPTANSTTTWGSVIELGTAKCLVLGTGTGATCYVTKVSGGVPTIALGYPGSGYSGSPTFIVYGAPTTFAGTQPQDCTGTLTQVGGLVTGIVGQCAQSDYNNGLLGVGPESLRATFQGASGGCGGVGSSCVIAGGVYLGGAAEFHIDYLHCERTNGSCLQLGDGSEVTSAGFVTTVDSVSTFAGDLIHVEPGNDCQTRFFALQFNSKTGTPNLMHDDCLISGGNGTSIQISTASSFVVNLGSIFSLEDYDAGNMFLSPTLFKLSNGCNVSSDVTLSTSATSFCTFQLPNIARSWSVHCDLLWSVTAGTTPTIAFGVSPVVAPASSSNFFASVWTTNPVNTTPTGSSSPVAVTAAGNTNVVTSAALTIAATIFSGSLGGTLNAAAGSGNFSITATLGGTTPAGVIRGGTGCYLY
jgi:hypothetical protein